MLPRISAGKSRLGNIGRCARGREARIVGEPGAETPTCCCASARSPTSPKRSTATNLSTRAAATCRAFRRGRTSRCGSAAGCCAIIRLWNDPAERRRYCIAVLRERDGEGSRQLHEAVRVGDPVEVSLPRNNFPLAEEARAAPVPRRRHRHHPDHGDDRRAAPSRRRVPGCITAPARPRRPRSATSSTCSAAQGRVRFHHDGGDPGARPRYRRDVARPAARDPPLLLRPARA